MSLCIVLMSLGELDGGTGDEASTLLSHGLGAQH